MADANGLVIQNSMEQAELDLKELDLKGGDLDLKVESSPMQTGATTDTDPDSAAGAGGDDGSQNKVEYEDDEDERKLFVGALNWDTTKDQMKDYFQKFGDVTEVILKEDINGRSRGFGFVTFANSAGREKVLAEGKHELHGRNIDPKKVIPRIYKIFVGALDPSLTEQEIKDHFSQYGEIVEMDLPYNKAKGERRAFAFIRYKSEEAVNKALMAPKTKLGDRECEIKKALPNQKGTQGFGHPRQGFRGGRGRGGWGYGGHGYFPPGYGNYSGYGGYSGYNGGYPQYGGYEQYNNWGGDYQQQYGSGGGGNGGGGAAWL